MTAVRVESKYGQGLVDIENWINPKTYLIDICLENGDTMPKPRNFIRSKK